MFEDVSIVIPTYNGGDLFQQCLEGLVKQDFPGKFEIVVIDSGSSDSTVELAEKVPLLSFYKVFTVLDK